MIKIKITKYIKFGSLTFFSDLAINEGLIIEFEVIDHVNLSASGDFLNVEIYKQILFKNRIPFDNIS
jgi:hypothetical protein